MQAWKSARNAFLTWPNARERTSFENASVPSSLSSVRSNARSPSGMSLLPLKKSSALCSLSSKGAGAGASAKRRRVCVNVGLFAALLDMIFEIAFLNASAMVSCSPVFV